MKIKASEMAKEFGMKANVFVEKCQDAGFDEVRTMAQHLPVDKVDAIRSHFQSLVDKKEEKKVNEKKSKTFRCLSVIEDDDGMKSVVVTDVPLYTIEMGLVKKYGSEKFKSRLGDEWLQANYDFNLLS